MILDIVVNVVNANTVPKLYTQQHKLDKLTAVENGLLMRLLLILHVMILKLVANQT